jgi:hypothetical protein
MPGKKGKSKRRKSSRKKKKPKPRPKYTEPTKEEQELAVWGLGLLENNSQEVGLAPAPDPRFRGHKIRVVISNNPAFYARVADSRHTGGDGGWHGTGSLRKRAIAAMKRVIGGRKHWNGLENELLEELEEDARNPDNWI